MIYFVEDDRSSPKGDWKLDYVTIRGIPDESSTNCIANVLKIYNF